MKKFNMYLLLLALVLIPTLQSCDNDDDGYSLDNYAIALVSVKKDANGAVSFVSDKGTRLWPAASLVPYRDLADGTRLMASFTILSDKQGDYDHYVRLNDYNKVLTKDVVKLTAANKDSIGDDKVHITDMWLSGGYLNVEFNMNMPSSKKHLVNLVENTTQTDPNDGYVYLEYRYNNMDDVTGYWGRSIVSFKIGTLIPTPTKGFKVRINSAVNGEKTITLDSPIIPKTKSLDFKNIERNQLLH